MIGNLNLHRSPQAAPQRRKQPRPPSNLPHQRVMNPSTSLKRQLRQLKLDKVDVVRLEVVALVVPCLVLALELGPLQATWTFSGTTHNSSSFGNLFTSNRRCSSPYFSSWVLAILNSRR